LIQYLSRDLEKMFISDYEDSDEGDDDDDEYTDTENSVSDSDSDSDSDSSSTEELRKAGDRDTMSFEFVEREGDRDRDGDRGGEEGDTEDFIKSSAYSSESYPSFRTESGSNFELMSILSSSNTGDERG
jgi:hypothetical protein